MSFISPLIRSSNTGQPHFGLLLFVWQVRSDSSQDTTTVQCCSYFTASHVRCTFFRSIIIKAVAISVSTFSFFFHPFSFITIVFEYVVLNCFPLISPSSYVSEETIGMGGFVELLFKKQ